jgi:ATP-binding cassette subfamily F protein uup
VVWSKISWKYSDFRAYEDSTDVQKEGKQSEKKDWKQNNPGNLTFNEQKEYQKIEKEIKDLEFKKCNRAIIHGRKSTR